MKVALKPLHEQVIVITGATSGIGLATARMAANAGARLVLAARSEAALGQLVKEIDAAGGSAVAVPADIAQESASLAIAAIAKSTYGGFDTWINNAGIGIYGRVEDVSIADMRRAFEVNYWGLVYGSREAARQLKRSGGGAIINLGSEVSERSVPLQGAYAATKHAIKGFTEALRMELEHEGAPISVTLVKPAQINTPFTVNAKNYLPSEPQHVPAVYAPEVVASAILRSAVKPVRSVYVGGGGALVGLLGQFAPGLTDRLMEKTVIPGTPTGRLPRRAKDQSGLDVPTEALTTVGNYPGHVARFSLYTQAALHPVMAGAVAVGLGLLLKASLSNGSHRPARILGARGGRTEKALHVRLEARPGREAQVEELLRDILDDVQAEPATGPWFGVRLSKRVFGIFERFPNERGRRAHLTGQGAARLMARSNALLAKPAEVSRLDVIGMKW